MGVNILLIAGSVTLAILFFRKRSSLPRAYIAFACAALALRSLDELGTYVLPAGGAADWAPLVRDAIVAGIWIAYFSNSRRVAATFVERLVAPPVAPAAPPGTGVGDEAAVPGG